MAQERVQLLLAALASPWVAAARSAAPAVAAGRVMPLPPDDVLSTVLLPRLGWAGHGGAAPTLLASLTVRAATALLLRPAAAARAAARLSQEYTCECTAEFQEVMCYPVC